MKRQTLDAVAEVHGNGLFTGRPAGLRIHPGETGLVLRRGQVTIPATVRFLAPQPPGMPARNTVLAASATELFITTEHVLSALVGLGITDALVEFTGAEAPIGDGSTGFIVEAIRKAGLQQVAGAAEPLVVSKVVTVEAAGSRITASPRSTPGCSYAYELDYGPGAPIPAQRASWDSERDSYEMEVGPARTFCLQQEAEQMRAAGLFRDLSPRDLLVIGKDGPIENAYRFENECARHKLLDLIGDLALVGRPIQADIVAVRAGHALNHQMARALVG